MQRVQCDAHAAAGSHDAGQIVASTWVAIRNSLDTRLYWFYLAIITGLGLTLNALRDNVHLSSGATIAVLVVMGSAVITGCRKRARRSASLRGC